jgi:hypothetical protein
MGCYVNPRDSSKEVWLVVHGRECGRIDDSRREIPVWESFESGRLPVVLVLNTHFGGFTAAGVCYCAAEYVEFTRLDDSRPREIYSVAIEDLRGVSDIDDYLK